MSGPVEPSMAPVQAEPCSRAPRFARAAVTLLFAGLLLGGCGSIFGSDSPEIANSDPPNVIYGQAEKMVNKGDYEEEARQYEQVDINHPYSQEARRSIVMASYSYYKAGKYDEAIVSAEAGYIMTNILT